PGVLASVPALAHASRAQIISLRQCSLHGRIVLSLIAEPSIALEEGLHKLARELSLECQTRPLDTSHQVFGAEGVSVTILGDLKNGAALAQCTSLLLSEHLQLQEAKSLGNDSLKGIELLATPTKGLKRAEFRELQRKVLQLGTELGVDVAVQRDDIYRRNKRLLCMDVDSTFVQGEFIDDLAEMMNVKDEVAAITRRAMQGELDFEEALRERVKLLRGLSMAKARTLCETFTLTPGADELVRTTKELGMKIGLVSGGFDFFVEALKEKYDLDFAFANELEVEDGMLTGEVIGTVVDPQRKAQVLKDMAHVFNIRLEQTIAAGDGANDIDMLQTAGLGIAYQAKPKLKEFSDTNFDHHDRLDTMLYLMGLDADRFTQGCS
ncbi:MAG: phosphoserine phosphatase SerB, partial [Polyangiaceae bacterium]|nr:phosphoserine phosphatase SerB [Polyangiaceae bacterium]